jgi:hypothetical protein
MDNSLYSTNLHLSSGYPFLVADNNAIAGLLFASFLHCAESNFLSKTQVNYVVMNLLIFGITNDFPI